jgi:hypothetical protein
MLAGLALAVWGCRPGPAADIPPDWLWDQDQTLIVPSGGSRNAWNGWAIDADAFVAGEPTSRMIFWLKTGRKAKLQITYTLNGRPVRLLINKRTSLRLEPTLVEKSGEFDVVLNAGRNFLEFQNRSGDLLRVKRIAVDGAGGTRGPHLLQGESVTFYLNPGRGRIEWSGSGEMTFEKRESDSGRLNPVETSRKTRFLSKTVKYELEMRSPGILTARADSGQFDVSRFVYKEDAPPPSPEKTRALNSNPPIFIILTDACQAEHLGTYGYPRPTSPRIDEFARDAIIFENAYANASFTRSSVRSLLTGPDPRRRQRPSVAPRVPQGQGLPDVHIHLGGHHLADLRLYQGDR